jgi:20S proteasome subunit alpha 5
MQLGSTAIGIQTSEGVILAVEKRLTSPLLEPSSVEKIMEIDAHIGAAMSGLTGDAKTLIDYARVEALVRRPLPNALSPVAPHTTHNMRSQRVHCADVTGLLHHQNHTFTFDEPMSVESCTQAVCDLALRFGEDRKSEKAMVHTCVHMLFVHSFSALAHVASILSFSSP